MRYFKSYHDKHNYTYSIDNLVIEYKLGISNIDTFTKSIQELTEKYLEDKTQYWERLNCPICSKYQYYDNHIHLRDGIYLMIGKWYLFNDKKDKSMFPMVKIDINPNKHFEKQIFKDLLQIIKPDIADWTIKRFDIAIDIPEDIDNVQILKSRKDKGLYRGTRYYGHHNHNGFCKIYDKQEESKLDDTLTRLEHTIILSDKVQKPEKIIEKLSLEDVYIKCNDKKIEKLSSALECIKEMAVLLKQNNIECDYLIDKLPRPTKKKIIENIGSCHYEKYIYDRELIKRLLDDIISAFTAKRDIEEDENGFLVIERDIDIPFK